MKTRVCRLYGKGDLRIETEEAPSPGPGQVLVGVASGGICGSDMHYYYEGGIGTIRVREPVILGHEASGRVISLGDGVQGLAVGDGVAINPSKPCGNCAYCTDGLPTHCLKMRFSGSAMHLPHEQGMFRDLLVAEQRHLVKLPDNADLGAVACAEPLAVCLHAAHMAGDLSGKRVLVTGAGPIGSLCAAVSAAKGAAEIVVTDLEDNALNVAQRMGATDTINVGQEADRLAAFNADKGYFDIAFECSAAEPAIRAALGALRPRGTLVQVGMTGDMPMPLNPIVAKELRLQGTFRFHEEFAEAVTAITSGLIDVQPIITDRFDLNDANQAFQTATNRSTSVKVHLQFDNDR